MRVQKQIEQKLREKLIPTWLDVVNESSMHSVPPGSETHFKVTIVSETFEGKSLVDRHRVVYATLDDEIRGGVHALTITSRTPVEWQRTQDVAQSPPCLGGSKAD